MNFTLLGNEPSVHIWKWSINCDKSYCGRRIHWFTANSKSWTKRTICMMRMKWALLKLLPFHFGNEGINFFCHRVVYYCDYRAILLNCWIRYFCSECWAFAISTDRARVFANANCRDNYIEHVMCKNKTNQLSMMDEACRFTREIPSVLRHLCHLRLLPNNNNKCHILLAAVETKTKFNLKPNCSSLVNLS